MQTPTSSARAISIRRWSPQDDDFVAALASEAFSEYDARPARYLRRLTQGPSYLTWVAVAAGEPIGMVVLGQRDGQWWILAVAVTARARARGVGALLMHTAEAHAASAGARRLSLFTADSNLAALDLFLRRGFRIVGRRVRFYAGGQDACELVMQYSRSS